MLNTKTLIRKIACLATVSGMLVSATGCFTFMRAVAEVNAEDTVEEFINEFFAGPLDIDFEEYIDDKVRFDLTSEQEEFFYVAVSDVTFSITETDLSSKRDACDITVTFKHAYDINDIDLEGATLEEYVEELDNISYSKEDIEFTVERDRYEQWFITDYGDFEDFFMTPFEDLEILEGGSVTPVPTTTDPTDPTVVPSSPSGSNALTSFTDIKNAYIYSVWYDVELDQPMDSNSVGSEKAYAVKNVFYFNAPVSATITAELYDSNGSVVLSHDINVDGSVICACDFSAGLEGMVEFASGDYYIVISMDGNEIATSDTLSVG
ncbi:MAG: hypothetical protein K5745_06290 [Saccharofermentans sp.]|nr:hypothetical protein [Saccharofermentans sp.]